MPELPEVERVRQTLEPHLLGRTVLEARLLRRDIWTPAPTVGRTAARSKRPDTARTAQQLLEGARIDRLDRRGKQLAVIAKDGRVLLVHLGMTGQFCFRAAAAGQQASKPRAARSLATDKHVHARWRIGAGSHAERHAGFVGELTFRDPRRFGGLWSFASLDQLAEHWTSLGPDALTVTTAELVHNLGRSRRAIKAGLLDQAAVAGVGNIYADEALFRSGIHPLRLCTRLSPPEWDLLASEIRAVLREAIAAGGSTLRDYVDADGQAGEARGTHRVYGRGGQACFSCGKRLQQSTVAQRTTVSCATCQPRGRRTARR